MIEASSEFAANLNSAFTTAKVIWGDAADLASLKPFEAERQAGATVSGLPLLMMPREKVRAILEGAFLHMRQGASFYQFTYGPAVPIAAELLQQLGLCSTRIGGVIWNFPPASVYRISRQ